MLIRGRGDALVRVTDGARLYLQDVVVRGAPLEVIGGSLDIQGSTLHVGISIIDGGEFRIRDSYIEDPVPGLQSDGGLLVMERVQVVQNRPSAYPTLSFDASNVQMRGVRVVSTSGHVAMRTRGCPWLDMQDVALQGLDVAWESHSSTAVIVDGVLLQSRRLGLQWQGPWDSQWQWRNIRIRSPQHALGVNIADADGRGPDPAVMERLPALD
ncbi:MAG: hypothetical protein EA401_11275 [Planctomycetota bacterium]|nr:MAG: hypothetical protein EA401_11275 [Planctomycetota bacterium]